MIELRDQAQVAVRTDNETLLQSCVDQGFVDTEFATPELRKSIFYNTRMTMLLLDAGADARVINVKSMADVLLGQHYLLAIRLIEKGAETKGGPPEEMALLEVCALNHLRGDLLIIPQMLLSRGAEPAAALIVLAGADDGDNPDSLRFAELLIAHGVDVNEVSTRQWTALRAAKEHHNDAFAKLLIEHGAKE